MKKKHLVIVGVIILSATVILGLYQSFALSGDITKDTSGYYNVTVTDGTTVTVPAGSTKTVYYKLTNTNKGIVKYGVGYSGTNITVKYYNDTQDPITGTVDYGKSKFIKLSVENSGTVSSTATLSTILGYENGGDLIVPSGVTLVTKMFTEPLATTLTNLYNNSTKTAVVNNGITYQYAPKNTLMKDIGGNIRYFGVEVNNYIYFNCSDYSNQSSSTCETWRIIGVFNGKLKLIRNKSIGAYSWDNKDTTTGADTDYGDIDWANARLMKLLNPGYESETVGGSLYYNSESGSCYSGTNNATVSCDFTSTGMKNDTTRNMIASNNWPLLSWYEQGLYIYADEAYEYERTKGSVYDVERPTSWTGKIALAYVSDYEYTVDFESCTDYLVGTSVCSSWMNSVNFQNSSMWLLNPPAGPGIGFHIDLNGSLAADSDSFAAVADNIFPVLYLQASTSIKSGTGTGSDPYQINVD